MNHSIGNEMSLFHAPLVKHDCGLWWIPEQPLGSWLWSLAALSPCWHTVRFHHGGSFGVHHFISFYKKKFLKVFPLLVFQIIFQFPVTCLHLSGGRHGTSLGLCWLQQTHNVQTLLHWKTEFACFGWSHRPYSHWLWLRPCKTSGSKGRVNRSLFVCVPVYVCVLS